MVGKAEMGASSGSDEINESRQIRGFNPLCQWTGGQGEIQALDPSVCVLSRGHAGHTHGRKQECVRKSTAFGI